MYKCIFILVIESESRDVPVKLIRSYLCGNVCAKFPKPRFSYLSALPLQQLNYFLDRLLLLQ